MKGDSGFTGISFAFRPIMISEADAHPALLAGQVPELLQDIFLFANNYIVERMWLGELRKMAMQFFT